MTDDSAIQQLQKILTVEQLPAMPHSALTVLQLDNDVTKVDIGALVKPIEADPGLAAQVLKFLNSSYFGFQSTISNVKQGVALVGVRVVKNFVLWKAVFSLIPKSKSSAFNQNSLWQDSLRRAMFSRFILMDLKKGDPEMAFAGALLQDMAIPLLLKQMAQPYGDLLARHQEAGDKRLSEMERAMFGWTHADAAGVLGKNWKLPDPLIVLVANHLEIEELSAQRSEKTDQFAVALSALLPMTMRTDWPEKDVFFKHFQLLFPDKPNLLRSVFEKVDREFEQYALVIQIAKPKQSLCDYLES